MEETNETISYTHTRRLSKVSLLLGANNSFALCWACVIIGMVASSQRACDTIGNKSMCASSREGYRCFSNGSSVPVVRDPPCRGKHILLNYSLGTAAQGFGWRVCFPSHWLSFAPCCFSILQCKGGAAGRALETVERTGSCHRHHHQMDRCAM